MRCTLLTLMLGIAISASAIANDDRVVTLVDEDVQLPEIVRLDAVDLKTKQIARTLVIVRPISETVERIEVVNGVERKVLTLTRYVEEVRAQRKDYKKLRAVTRDGKEVSPVALKKAIDAGKLVLLSTDRNGNISKNVAELFNDDAILILGIPVVTPAARARPGDFDPYGIPPYAPATSTPTLAPTSPTGRITAPPSLTPPPRGN
jgi:hypothetical protein